MTSKKTCPLCFKSTRSFAVNGGKVDVKCDRCGSFRAAASFAEEPPRREDGFQYLRAAARQASDVGQPITVTLDNWRKLVEPHRSTPAREKSMKLLRYFGSRARTLEALVTIDADNNYPVLDAISLQECEYFVSDLVKRGLFNDNFGNDADEYAGIGQITPKGWELLQASENEPGRCFVAMAFAPQLDAAYYAGIKQAILDCGYRPVCLKEIATNDDIADLILSEIRRSQFVVADFTRQKAGVYFEAGFAKALGKEVFWTCKDTDFHRLHFDTNHYGHIKWSNPNDLRKQLTDRILAELGRGPFRNQV